MAIICNNIKEMILDKFYRKLKEASCHLRQTEPFTPWSNAAEREKKELKQGYVRKLIKWGIPKRLWDDCLELESYVQYCTWHIQTETILSRETSDINLFCEFEWFKWVMF